MFEEQGRGLLMESKTRAVGKTIKAGFGAGLKVIRFVTLACLVTKTAAALPYRMTTNHAAQASTQTNALSDRAAIMHKIKAGSAPFKMLYRSWQVVEDDAVYGVPYLFKHDAPRAVGSTLLLLALVAVPLRAMLRGRREPKDPVRTSLLANEAEENFNNHGHGLVMANGRKPGSCHASHPSV